MKTVKQATIVGQVQSIGNNDYLVEFVIKTIREGEVTWLNATATGWEAWNLRTGDEVLFWSAHIRDLARPIRARRGRNI